MTSPVARLYALVLAVLVFFLAWAVVAAHPWQQRAAAADPRLTALAARHAQLQRESVLVRRIVAQRYAAYRVELARRQHTIAQARAVQSVVPAAAPAVAAPISLSTPAVPTVVSVPAVATTRTS